MVKTVKITRKKNRGYILYSISIPKAIVEALGQPDEVAVRLEVKDGKPFILLEPLYSQKPKGGEVKP